MALRPDGIRLADFRRCGRRCTDCIRVDLSQLHGAANAVALVRLEKLTDSAKSHVARTEAFSVDRVDLRVRVEVVDALNVTDEDLLVACFPREVRKRLRHLVRSVNVSIVVIVLDVLPAEKWLKAHDLSAPLAQPQHGDRHKADFAMGSERFVEAKRVVVGQHLRHGLVEAHV
eukprot:2128355-Rhodomonas_salina.1